MMDDLRIRDQRIRAQSRERRPVLFSQAQDDARVFVATAAGEDQFDGTTIVSCVLADVDALLEEGGAVTFSERDDTIDVIVVGEDLTIGQGDLLLARRVHGDWYAIHRQPCTSPRTLVVRVTVAGVNAPGQSVAITRQGVVVASGVTNGSGRISATIRYPAIHQADVLNADGESIASATTSITCSTTTPINLVIAL